MADLKALKQIEVAKSKLADKAVAGFVGELESILKRLNRRVAALLKALETDGDGRLVSDAANLARASQARSQISRLLQESGYGNAAANLVAAYDEMAVLSKAGLAAGGVLAEFTRLDIASIQALKDMDFGRWARFGDDFVESVHANIMDSVVGLSTFDGLVDSIQETLLGGDEQDRAAAVGRAETMANTLAQSFDRTLTARKAAESGIDTFVYLGPEDGLTRPFCQAVLSGDGDKEFNIPATENGVYTLEQIEAMDNGVPGLQVLQFGGGYNCRHKFEAVAGKVAQEAAA